MDYHKKYIKYKTKYLQLKKHNMNGGAYPKDIPNFYIIHGIFKPTNLKYILNDGYIKIGKELPSKHLIMSTPEHPHDYIFGSVYFEDLKNLSYFWQSSIVLHPKLIWDHGCIFKCGWSGGILHKNDIIIKRHDIQFKKKIQQMHDFIKNPIGVIDKENAYMTHEIIFNKKINIKKYALMVTCNFCDDKNFKKIKKLIKDHNYKFKILNGNSPMPTLKELINNDCHKRSVVDEP